MPAEAIAIDQITGIISYLQNIDWTEPWLLGLISAHVLCFLLTLCSLVVDSFVMQTSLFCLYLVPVYAMEYINEWAAENYKKFSREQYFDSQGLFISLLVSAPLLVNACIFLFAWLYQAYKMLIKVKTVRTKAKDKAKSKVEASKGETPKEKTSGEKKTD